MPPTLDLSQDYLVWDNLEGPAQYEVARTGGNLVDVLPVVKRRAVSGGEKSPSGGVYVGNELNWHLPQATLTAGLVPKPADVLIDPIDGTRWTVLRADWNKWRNTWKLGCVDLTLALDLRDTIDIERAALTFDGAGVAVKTFPPQGGQVLYAQIAARVQLLTDEVLDERGIRGFVGRHDIIVDRQVSVTNEDRIVWTDPSGTRRIFDVVGYKNPTRIDELPVIEAQLRP